MALDTYFFSFQLVLNTKALRPKRIHGGLESGAKNMHPTAIARFLQGTASYWTNGTNLQHMNIAIGKRN